LLDTLGAAEVNETSLFLTLTSVSTLLVSTWIVRNRVEAASQIAAQTFCWISATLSVAALLWITLDVLGWLRENSASNWWFRVLIYRAWLVIGTAVSCAVLLVLNGHVSSRFAVASKATQVFLTSSYVLKGISLSVSISFICTEIGKLAHDTDMRQFFLQSGYPVWFLYFIMIAETVGAIGLLSPRTVIPSALGLSAIMIGAIGTHIRNRDPFSDSLEAVHLLLLLACLLVIRLLRGRSPVQQISLS
jgi:uncharacterized membrane protein YphA (DoxX/SURF4 family)